MEPAYRGCGPDLFHVVTRDTVVRKAGSVVIPCREFCDTWGILGLKDALLSLEPFAKCIGPPRHRRSLNTCLPGTPSPIIIDPIGRDVGLTRARGFFLPCSPLPFLSHFRAHGGTERRVIIGLAVGPRSYGALRLQMAHLVARRATVHRGPPLVCRALVRVSWCFFLCCYSMRARDRPSLVGGRMVGLKFTVRPTDLTIPQLSLCYCATIATAGPIPSRATFAMRCRTFVAASPTLCRSVAVPLSRFYTPRVFASPVTASAIVQIVRQQHTACPATGNNPFVSRIPRPSVLSHGTAEWSS
ncbi:peptidase M13 [Anopheles sinensis]|uniref:Peptidase M13 n=1 Tax=Anopheles sinensis TaxID=74873 RepID=A0A084VTV4_ANOSI|nr:peptidase M13 [Anopheles sinensis]